MHVKVSLNHPLMQNLGFLTHLFFPYAGHDLFPIDLITVRQFAQRVLDLLAYMKKPSEYLVMKMNYFAPNLTQLIGKLVGARLISILEVFLIRLNAWLLLFRFLEQRMRFSGFLFSS